FPSVKSRAICMFEVPLFASALILFAKATTSGLLGRRREVFFSLSARVSARTPAASPLTEGSILTGDSLKNRGKTLRRPLRAGGIVQSMNHSSYPGRLTTEV